MENPTPRLTIALVLAMTLAAGVLPAAAPPNDFYLGLLSRGVAHANSGNNALAIKELRIAAFGLVDDIDQFALAEAYLAVVAQRLALEQEARHALQRLVAAERVERHYGTLPLPADVRAALEKTATSLLSADQTAMLHREGSAPLLSQVPQPVPASVAVPIAQAPAPPSVVVTPLPAEPAPVPITPTPRAVAPAPMPAAPAPARVTRAPRPETPTPPAPTQLPTAPLGEPLARDSSGAVPRQRVTTTELPQDHAPQQPDRVVPENSLRREQERMTTERRIEERTTELERNALPPADRPSPSSDVRAKLTAADAAFASGDVAEARDAYARLVEAPALDRTSALHLGEALYDAGDYRSAVRAYQRVGTFRPGEEQQRYTFALALYETGSYRAAKRELATALPKLEQTPEVTRNRAKIEGAIE